jgi:hypothetical protein
MMIPTLNYLLFAPLFLSPSFASDGYEWTHIMAGSKYVASLRSQVVSLDARMEV